MRQTNFAGADATRRVPGVHVAVRLAMQLPLAHFPAVARYPVHIRCTRHAFLPRKRVALRMNALSVRDQNWQPLLFGPRRCDLHGGVVGAQRWRIGVWMDPPSDMLESLPCTATSTETSVKHQFHLRRRHGQYAVRV